MIIYHTHILTNNCAITFRSMKQSELIFHLSRLNGKSLKCVLMYSCPYFALLEDGEPNKFITDRTTVDSRYLEVEGTFCNNSRYPYFDISDFLN